MTIDRLMLGFFEAENSLNLIKIILSGEPRARGYQARLSEHIGCHPSHLSKVLKGDTVFTLEQACAAARFWHLGELRALILLTLVSIDRAGTDPLRTLLHENLDLIRHELRYRMP